MAVKGVLREIILEKWEEEIIADDDFQDMLGDPNQLPELVEDMGDRPKNWEEDRRDQPQRQERPRFDEMHGSGGPSAAIREP